MDKNIKFEEMIDEYSKPILRYIFSHIHNLEISEDLTQQTFIKIWKKREKILAMQYPISYLYKTALNEIRMHIRNNHALETIPVGIEVADPNSLSDIEIDNIPLLLDELSKLSALDREIITFRYLQQMNNKETSIAVGKPQTATRIALFRALKKLKTNIIKTKSEEKK